MNAQDERDLTAPLSATARFLALFDAFADMAYGTLTLFDKRTPGASATLRLWVGARNFEVRSITYPARDEDGPFTVVECTTPAHATITVHLEDK